MDIRPVDMQVMVQRAAMLNRATNNDGSRAETQNTQFANEFARATEQEQKAVVQTPESENAELNKDGRGPGTGGDGKGKKKGEKKGGEPPKKNIPGMSQQGMLDIKI